MTSKIMNKNLNAEEIEWIDSTTSTNCWVLQEDYDPKETTPINIKTFGCVVEETTTYIVVAQNYGNNPPQFCNLITIPKGCIINRKTIK